MKYAWLNVIAIIAVVAVNALANALPINGQTTGEISNKLDVLFTPAGYVFSIWGLIYFLLFLWSIRQFPAARRNAPVYRKATPLHLLSSLLNIGWIFSWHYEYFLLSVIVMAALLLTLIALYQRIKDEHSLWDTMPFSIYLGWICVATIANISYYLTFVNWKGFGLSDVSWTFIMLIAATLLAAVFAYKNRDPIFSFVFIWAFIGIGARNADSYPSISYTAIILAAFILVLAILHYLNNTRSEVH